MSEADQPKEETPADDQASGRDGTKAAPEEGQEETGQQEESKDEGMAPQQQEMAGALDDGYEGEDQYMGTEEEEKDEKLNLFRLQREKKQAVEDAQLLANRIALLK